MAKPKLDLRRRKDLEIPVFAQGILTQISGDPRFPNPLPPLSEVEAALASYKEAVAEQRQVEASLRQATTVKRTRRKHLEKLLTQLAGYVGYASSGKAAVIQAAGMAASGAGSPVGTLPAPENLRAQPGTFDGEVILRWRAMPRVRIFEIEYKLDGQPGDWQRATPVTRSRASLRDLTPGQRYTFRVRALATAGPSPWSDPAFSRAG